MRYTDDAEINVLYTLVVDVGFLPAFQALLNCGTPSGSHLGFYTEFELGFELDKEGHGKYFHLLFIIYNPYRW